MWDTRTDELYCNMNMMEECKSKLTRRVLLSIVHRIFDPIGILSPTTVVPKLLLQRTWELKIGWDTELPEDISEEFRKWLQYLPLLRDFRIPRRFCTKPYNEGRKSLHVFCDSSSKAYATCVFVRTEVDDDVTVRLVMAKARVAPVKKITIPRLELMAAVMATRVYVQVKEGLTLDGYEVYFWSDSSVALTWIMTDGDWSLFVKNRVREIREHTHTEDWRYVSGTKNPADLPSRGCSPKKLLEEQWWEGPAWLKQKSSEWPVTIMFERNDEAIDSERSKIVREHVDTIEEDFSQRFNQQSNFTRIVRTAAWVNRFCKNCRANKNNEDNQTRIVPSNPARTAESRNVKSLMEGVEPITAKEFEEAEVTLYKLIQRSECKENDKGSNIDIFEGEDGLRRVRTRLTLSDYDETFKCPILLSGKHPLVAKLIESTHKRKMHAGTNVLAAELRNTVWITGARRAIRNITSKCVICKRFNGKSYETPCPPLPENRIKDAAPFQVTGVDAAGPMILKTGGKTWIMLFTCAIYRAIHIEVVTSMTTDSFLMALRRFIARRGRCEIIYSDNGTNFRGAENHLSIIDWEKMKEFSTANKIRWIFNPPAAPWWGGWWERMIQMVKQLLRRNLGKSTLTLVELQTVLCDVENIINSRPLTYVNEVDGWQPLTPAHFLRTIPSGEVPDIDHIDAKSLNIRLQYLQKLRTDLRQRFKNEYLSLLVCRNKKSTRPVRVGDVVIVETEGKKLDWPLGIVTEVCTGKDGVRRVAKVKTADGERTRAVQRLHPLEINNDEESEVLAKPDKRTTSGRIVRPPKRLDC
ncbi:hypothetical protein JYU34_000276 [Plutella xylostella]|nr:hypothetical protein JYU34_000276 [Plutella xylostella]